MGSRGQTLIEILLASFLGSAILASVIALITPYSKAFNSILSFGRLRNQLFTPLDTIQKDVVNAREVFVDGSKCYAMCMVDNTTGNRVSYYWVNSDLYRKVEPVSNAIACNGGKPIAYGLDKPNTSFSTSTGLVHVRLGGKETQYSSSYRLNTSAYPAYQEAATLLSLGVECNTGSNWSFQTSTDTFWVIANTGQGFVLQANRNQGGSNSESAIAEITVDLGRFTNPYLSFEYMNEGNIKTGDYLKLQFWDGANWVEIFSDATSDNISFHSVTLDLSSFSLNASNKLRFVGSLAKNPATWSVRNIEIVSR